MVVITYWLNYCINRYIIRRKKILETPHFIVADWTGASDRPPNIDFADKKKFHAITYRKIINKQI